MGGGSTAYVAMLADAAVEVLCAALPPGVIRGGMRILAIEDEPRLAAVEVLLLFRRGRGYLVLESEERGLKLIVTSVAKGGGLVEGPPCRRLRHRANADRAIGGRDNALRCTMHSHEVVDSQREDDGDENVVAWAKAHGELRLVGALDEVEGQRLEWIGGGAEGLERGEGVLDELVGVLARTLETEDRGPRGLVRSGVFARSLAELLRGLRDVEDVVNDLGREAGLLAERAETRDDVGGGAGEL